MTKEIEDLSGFSPAARREGQLQGFLHIPSSSFVA